MKEQEHTEVSDPKAMRPETGSKNTFAIETVTPGLRIFARGEEGDSDSVENWIGTVDHMEGDRYIKLAKSGSSDGKHHWIPVDWVDCAAQGALYLKKSVSEANSSMLNSLPTESLN